MLRGMVKNTKRAVGSVIATLPKARRPKLREIFAIVCMSSPFLCDCMSSVSRFISFSVISAQNAFARIDVAANGKIIYAGGGTSSGWVPTNLFVPHLFSLLVFILRILGVSFLGEVPGGRCVCNDV